MTNKSKLVRIISRVIVLLLVAALLSGIILTPRASSAGHSASSITRLDSVQIDYTDFADDSVLFELTDSLSPDEEISVIITMPDAALLDAYGDSDRTMSFAEYAVSDAADDLRQTVANRRDQILSQLDGLEIGYTAGRDYTTLLCGFELVLRAGDYAEVCGTLAQGENAVIGQVYRAAETELVENTVNVYETGIFNSADSGYDGTGMTVAVLDTGLDSNHSAFSVENFTSEELGLCYEDVAAVVSQTKASSLYGGLSVDDVYINEKVPFGYDYADNDPDVYSTHNNHGTHVSGVIVGKDDTITGVAPNAQLVSMKIFSDVEDTAKSAWILAALEDCVILGVDVINMSLGTACGFSHESEEELLSGVYDKIRDAGISIVVAASNSYSSAYGSEANGNLGLTSNPDTGTVGSPSTYDGALSVASINGVETPYLLYKDTIIYFDESNSGTGKENNFCQTLLGDQESVEMEFVVIPGVGRSADYTGMDVTGKIVLVRRGSNTFEEKAMIAEAMGAAGIIIYNNVSGDIKMNVGEAKIAVCSISQDDGEMLAELGGGKLTVSKSQTSGPFMSDFSSWGPTPDLKIKPEITAHGGNILSSVTGGGYDRLSGTSMACPNMAGFVVLMRQYVVENFPDIADDSVAVNAMVNRLMMSTADIILNVNGLPYSVRKQGAGLANLTSAIGTTAYITTYDETGAAMDKTKLELGDDKEKTGVYTLHFSLVNFGDESLSYDLGAYVMTEGVSETKTNAGKTTVTEEAYILSGASVEITAVDNGTLKDKRITVEAGQTADITVTVTLSDSDKAYLDASFENGMYVEGFVTLTAAKGTDIDLVVPYLAFYGDWTQAPMFDLTYFDTNADELDDGIDDEDKTKADAYPTRLIGGISGDYVSYLGSYYFVQNPEDLVISADEDHIALSNQTDTIHSLRFMWAGMLRAAVKVEVTITDDATGEVIYECVDTDVRKSYGDGGSIYPANVDIEFDTVDYNLVNNSTYTVDIVGYMDYDDGGIDTNLNNTYSFPLTVDFEAPTVEDVEFYYEYDKNENKNRLYAKVAVYDNHYSMAAHIGYVNATTDSDGNQVTEVTTFSQYLTPIYSEENGTTYLTVELTDHIYDIKANAYNPNTFVVTVYDYALNYATYEIELPDDYVDFYFDGLDDGLTLSPNEVFSLEPLVYPQSEWGELLEFTSSRPSVVRVVNNKLVAVASGTAVIKVRDPQTNEKTTFTVTVLKEGDEGYRRYDKPVADVFELTGYTTQKAYYMLSSEDKLIGDTGDTRFFGGKYELSMYPSESVLLNYKLDAYFPKDTTVEFETSNDSIVAVDEYGVVTARAEGFASITVKILLDGRSTYYSESVSVEVKDPYVTNAGILNHYYGNGGLVEIPAELSLTEIGSFAFANYDYIDKTAEELAEDDTSATKQWYIGESTITKVIIPEGVEKIGAYAFANLTALEEIVLPSTLQSIEYGAFYGCTSLQKITFSSENNLQIINQNAFENCDLQKTVDLSAACVISDYAFAGNVDLQGVITSDSLLSIGQYAFAGCKKLTDVTVTADKVKYGAYAFTGCESLEHFYVNASVLPEGMFYECDSMTSVSVGPEVNDIGEFAFRDTKISSIEICAGNTAFKVQTADHVLSADGSTLIALAPTVQGKYTNSDITCVGGGAFSHCRKLSSVELVNVATLGDYAFGSCDGLRSVKLGSLTEIGAYAFFETAITELPEFTADTVIGDYAFAFTALTEVTVPDGMTLGEGVFSQCMKLERVTVGDNVTVGDYAFHMDKDSSFAVKHYDENGERYFYYEFGSALKELTVGDNAVIGENAFAGAASLETVTLGAGARIGYMAFYNASSLRAIDLSQAVSIGDYAFSGDVYYVCLDENMSVAAVSTDGYYIYTYHAPVLERADLSAAEEVGAYAFAYCRAMTDAVLGEQITGLPEYVFAGCISLEQVNTGNLTGVGDYAFMECGKLTSVDLSKATAIGEYAFVNCETLKSVTLNPEGCELAEGAFCYSVKLSGVENLDKCAVIGDYAFAYTALTEADLTGARSIGTHAFMKEELTPFRVKLSEALETLGDNPFALCELESFHLTELTEFNGQAYETYIYTYDISDTVKVIDGILYCQVPEGLELIVYTGVDPENVHIAEGTVRLSAMCFAMSDVQMVDIPYTVQSIGHKAFYGCEALHTVIFNSYNAPVLEEEYDPTYYESMDHIPGSGDYGTYTDYDGTEVNIVGNGTVPYFMWNASGGLYNNVFYGANFVDYVGYVSDKLTMVRPVNGVGYDSYIYGQYFDTVLGGATAADDTTLAAIEAIRAIPAKVSYEQRHLVEQARSLYAKIATTEQLALVTNYADLISAEQRIIALTPTDDITEPTGETEPIQDDGSQGGGGSWIVFAVAVLGAGAAAAVAVLKKKKSTPQE